MRFLLKLFGEESAFGRFLNRLYVVIVTNLLFVLFSIPVITIGASLAAMNYTLMKFQRGDRHFKVAAMFWKGFRENFVKATVCFVALVLLVLFQLLEISWCRQFAEPMSIFQYVLAGLMVLEGILAMYLFPVIAAFNGGYRELLRDTLFFAFSKPHWMLLCLAWHVLPMAATYLFLQYLPLWAFLWLMFGFATIAYISTRIMLRQFMPFLPEVDICGDIIRCRASNLQFEPRQSGQGPNQLCHKQSCLAGMEGDPNIMVGDDDSGDDVDEKTLQEMMKYGL